MNKKRTSKLLPLLLITISLMAYQSVNGEESTNLSKQEEWDQLSQEVDTWADALGLGLDEKIKEPVIALNLIGIPSQQSCEGHLDWGLPYPWVQFATEIPGTEVVRVEMDFLINKILIQEKDLWEKFPENDWIEIMEMPEAELYTKLVADWYKLDAKLEEIMAIHFEHLQKLLEKFYENKKSIVYDNILIIVYNNETYRLCSLGVGRQAGRSLHEKESKLKEYQQEMKDFSDFLKNDYFNS